MALPRRAPASSSVTWFIGVWGCLSFGLGVNHQICGASMKGVDAQDKWASHTDDRAMPEG